MLNVMFVLAILIEIGAPVVLALVLLRRYHLGWRLVGVGALTFLGSQVVHIPLLDLLTVLFQNGTLPLPPRESLLVFNAVLLGLLAGLCEETARWIGYRWLKQRANSWGAALTLGAGHGGIESILFVGIPVLLTFVLMLLVQSGNAGGLGLSTDAMATLQSQAAQYVTMPWDLPLAGALERLMALVLHITLSVMVWLAVSRKNMAWFVAAILWHAVVDGAAIYLAGLQWSTWPLEGVVFGFTLLNFVILYLVWRNFREQGSGQAGLLAEPQIAAELPTAPVEQPEKNSPDIG